MIQAACWGRGNGEKNAEGLARAGSAEGSGKWEVGRVDRKEGGWEGVDGNGEGETGDCLSFFLSVRLWTAKPQGLTG